MPTHARHEIKINDAAAEILSAAGCGIRIVMTMSYMADEIGDEEEEEEGEREWDAIRYVRERLLTSLANVLGQERFWFDEEKLSDLLEEKANHADVGLAILALDDRGVCLWQALDEACLDEDMFSAAARKIYENKRNLRFADLVVEPVQVRVKRRWRIVKFAFIMLILHGRAAISANQPHRKKARKEFENEGEGMRV
jgi:hypothetical protein